ncbi:hypothetical protein CgunFtcFv8_000351 [Champsocephalus gunnari]|uniref:Uncharacterized protein n=1 Tax=Champsocephalus gunnari TaxID=52237 RepID=A0AAN8DLX9_CHAGU|nr:hypothetical protein CgunFtcFv8_000351 [Champsocephalus gunnari]
MRDEGKDGEAGMTAIRETRETVKSERIPWKEGCRGEMGQETSGSNERDGWRMRVQGNQMGSEESALCSSCVGAGCCGALSTPRASGRKRERRWTDKLGRIDSATLRHLTAKFAFYLIPFPSNLPSSSILYPYALCCFESLFCETMDCSHRQQLSLGF